MFARHLYGKYFISLFTFCFLGLCTIIEFNGSSHHGRDMHVRRELQAFTGIAGYLLFSLSLFLSSRWQRLENWIGGLDRIYHVHHKIGLSAFLIILVHPMLKALKFLPQRWDRFFLYLFPSHAQLAVNIGSCAYWLTIVLLVITITKILAYNKWKISHKWLIVAFTLATLHAFSFSRTSNSLLLIPATLGYFGIIHKTFFTKKSLYEVIETRIVNDSVIEISLLSKGKPLLIKPGQYAFFSFYCPKLTLEAHPFTPCGAPNGSKISIFVKARGDFTKALCQYVKPGCHVDVEGPYGRFDYTSAGKYQVWIAGGIGIVPFIAWIRTNALANPEQKVTLLHCVHRTSDALLCDELHNICANTPNFRYFVFSSEEQSRISTEKIAELCSNLHDSSVLMCGPNRLTTSLAAQLKVIGVQESRILFENFEFF